MNPSSTPRKRFNLEEDALPEGELIRSTGRYRHKKGAFIAGPFPMDQFRLAARLPGKALAVWQLIQHRLRVSGVKKEVTLPDPVAADFGMTANTKRRAIKQLEHIGLVHVNRRTNGTPWLLSLVALPENEDEEEM